VYAVRNGPYLIVVANSDLCHRANFLDITLVGWPGMGGAVTGTMNRCTNEVLLPCPMAPTYEIPKVTGSWNAFPGKPNRNDVTISINVQYQQEYWVKPPDPCKKSTTPDQTETASLVLIPDPAPPPPPPPPPFQDPLTAAQQQLYQNLQKTINKGIKQWVTDPPYTVQY
jgi:hypothetical protein